MDAARPPVKTSTWLGRVSRSPARGYALVAMAAAVLAGCATGGTTTQTTAPAASAAAGPLGSELLPVWHRTQSSMLGEDTMLWDLDRIGFVDTSGQVVTEPVYARYRVCPGPDGGALVVAQTDDRVDALAADGTVVGSAQASLAGCGPLPGYVELYQETDGDGGWDQWAAALPDLSRSDLPGQGVALDDDWLLVTSYVEADDALSTELVDRTGRHVPADGDEGWGYYYGANQSMLSTGEWPVPAADADGRQGYLDRTGRWVAPPRFDAASPFAHGYAAVSDGALSHFVDTSLTQVGPDYGQISAVVTTGPLFADVLGYTVTPPDGAGDDPETARSGLLTPNLKILADPATSRTDCRWPDSSDTVCLVIDDSGARLVTLPGGTSTPLPDGFTAVLSTHLVATADGTRVYSTATGTTFDVPAPFHALTDWQATGGDAFVVCESDNGLRLVLDATGARTPLASVEQAVTTTDGRTYSWVYAGDQQGYVDATGTWLYHESRHQITED